MSLNKAMIIGHLGRDPELRYTQSQQPVCQLSVATTRVYTNRAGAKTEETEWHRIVAWGKTAEHCNRYLTKGRQVYVEGRLQTRSWEDKDGKKRYSTEIVAERVTFLGGTRSDGDRSSGRDGASSPRGGDGRHDDRGRGDTGRSDTGTSDQYYEQGGHDDDIPF